MDEIQTRKSPVREMLGCALPIFWAGVICFSYPGIMTTYWQQRFNVGPTETGMVLSFMLVALAVSMFFSGKIHLRFGMQKCLFIGGALYVLSFLILMMAKSIVLVYVWAFIANLGCSFTYGPGMATGQQAMPNRRGLAGAGWVLEKTGGSFPVVFTYLGIFSAIGAALMVVLKKRNKENEK